MFLLQPYFFYWTRVLNALFVSLLYFLRVNLDEGALQINNDCDSVMQHIPYFISEAVVAK